MITVAMLVTDAVKTSVEADINAMDLGYTLGFSSRVCPIDEAVTWETPHTHWYMNDSAFSEELFEPFQVYAANNPSTVKFWSATNATDPLKWAEESNLASEGLMFVPPNI